VFRAAARELFGRELSPAQLVYKSRRARDPNFQEIALEVDGTEVLCFAKAYGLRNLANVVQLIKQRKCKYHYIEVMACPSGCLNGGGQVRATEPETPKALLERVSQLYASGIVAAEEPSQNLAVLELYRTWLDGIGGPLAQKLLHTQYRAVEKSEDHAVSTEW